MIEWMVRLRQAAIIMIITTPFLADSVCDSKLFSSLGLPKASVLHRPNNRSLSLIIQLVSSKSNVYLLKEKQNYALVYVEENKQCTQNTFDYEYLKLGTTLCSLRYSKSLFVAKQLRVMPSEGLTDE